MFNGWSSGRRPVVVAGLMSWLLACTGSSTGQPVLAVRNKVEPSILAFYRHRSVVTLPSSVRVGEPVSLRFTTIGGGCMGVGAVDVSVSGLQAVVRPYRSFDPLPDTVMTCTADLRFDPRTAELRFLKAGRATIRIIGHAVPEEREHVIVRHLQVTP